MHSSDPRAAQSQPRRRFHATLLASAASAAAALGAGGLLATAPAGAQQLRPTPGDFEGPYRPPKGTEWGGTDLMTSRDASSPGKPLVFAGRLLDTGGRPQPGLQVQVWQANATGRYDYHPGETPGHGRPDPAFRGHGESDVDAEGWFAFRTLRPGGYTRTLFGFLPWTFVPHIHVAVRAGGRDLLVTQAELDKVAVHGQAGARGDHAELMRSEAMRRLVAATGVAAVAGVGAPSGAELIRFDVVLAAGLRGA
jgi:protocatechuate 3,4-dioxygenase beta subunit